MGQPTQRFKKSMSAAIGPVRRAVLCGEGGKVFGIGHK